MWCGWALHHFREVGAVTDADQLRAAAERCYSKGYPPCPSYVYCVITEREGVLWPRCAQRVAQEQGLWHPPSAGAPAVPRESSRDRL